MVLRHVGALLVLGVICAPWQRITLLVLSLATVELGFGLGSAIMVAHGRGAAFGIFPEVGVRNATRVWHPLLQAANIPTPTGTRTRFHVDSQGLRGPERVEGPHRRRGVRRLNDGRQQAVRRRDLARTLETPLGPDRFAVLNREVSGNTTVQHVIRTAFYQDAYGMPPRCAVYYVGGQDLNNSHYRSLDPGYADYRTPNLVDMLDARHSDRAPVAISPLLRLLRRGATFLFDTVRAPADPKGIVSADPDPALEAIFAANIRSISAINHQRGVRAIWIGEVFNEAPPPPDVGPHSMWTPYIDLKDLHGLLAHLRGVLKHEAMALGDVYVDVDRSKLDNGHFTDGEHFSVKGAQAFATMIAPAIGEACSPPK